MCKRLSENKQFGPAAADQTKLIKLVKWLVHALLAKISYIDAGVSKIAVHHEC